MAKVVESVGKTYDEALKNGLEQLGLNEDDVNIEIVKDANASKKTFFSILEPRQVKLILTEKTKQKKEAVHEEKEIEELDEATVETASAKIQAYLKEYFETMDLNLTSDIKYEKGYFFVNIAGESSGLIIGHRGETLEALQVIVSAVANKGSEKRIRVILDSENYRDKRVNSLKGLALKEADLVVKKKKNYTFEPMTAFERKAIHSALQGHSKVTTYSVGEEPYRKVVIALK